SRKRGGAAIGRERSQIENLVHVALAYVFVGGIVGDKARDIRTGLGIKRGSGEVHAREKRVAGLCAVFACYARLCERSVRGGIVLARKVQGVLQRQPHGRARSLNSLRRCMGLVRNGFRSWRGRIGLLRGVHGRRSYEGGRCDKHEYACLRFADQGNSRNGTQNANRVFTPANRSGDVGDSPYKRKLAKCR